MMKSAMFQIKVDPRDISNVYLYDEQNKKYVQIPNADPEFGPISLEEYNSIRKILKRNRIKPDVSTIMKARENIADLIEGSITEKRKLLRGQKRAGSRAKDLAIHPKTSQETAGRPHQDENEPWVPEEFAVKLPE